MFNNCANYAVKSHEKGNMIKFTLDNFSSLFRGKNSTYIYKNIFIDSCY